MFKFTTNTFISRDLELKEFSDSTFSPTPTMLTCQIVVERLRKAVQLVACWFVFENILLGLLVIFVNSQAGLFRNNWRELCVHHWNSFGILSKS